MARTYAIGDRFSYEYPANDFRHGQSVGLVVENITDKRVVYKFENSSTVDVAGPVRFAKLLERCR